MSRATTDKRKQENLPVGHETQTRRGKKRKAIPSFLRYTQT